MNVVIQDGVYVLRSQYACKKCNSHWEAALAEPTDLRNFLIDIPLAPACNGIKQNKCSDIIMLQQYEGLPLANILCDNCNTFHWAEHIRVKSITEILEVWVKLSNAQCE